MSMWLKKEDGDVSTELRHNGVNGPQVARQELTGGRCAMRNALLHNSSIATPFITLNDKHTVL